MELRQNFLLPDILHHSGIRGKNFSWSEIFSYTALTPSEFDQKIILNHLKIQTESRNSYQSNTSLSQESPIPDPLWFATQSGKNYTSVLETLIKHYTQKELSTIQSDNYRVGLGVSLRLSQPMWAQFIYQDHWYWQQKGISKLSPWLYCIPGIKNIYLVGSGGLGISRANSDIDIAVETYPGCVLLTRFWLKFCFKLFRVDTYSFSFSLRSLVLQWLSKQQLLFPNLSSQKRKLSDQINSYRLRPGLKIDCGLIYSDRSKIEQYFTKDPRNFSILHRFYLSKGVADRQNLYEQSIGSITYYTENSFPILQLLIRGILLGMSLVVFPISLLQLFWQNLKSNSNPNHHLSWDMYTFYPRFPESHYLTKLKS